MSSTAGGARFGLISELAPRIASGELTAEALLDECLAAVEAHDRRGANLHAFLTLDPGARAQARALDAERRAAGVRGPLHGLPLAVKDNIDVEGLPTTSGCRALAGALPRAGDAAQVRRLRAAGAVVVGKTNLSEFSFEIRSRSSLGGDTLNPYDRRVTAGGSSGGTAAALAAGFAVIGLGSDTGGSIRTPAALTGLVGLRPTQGLLDRAGVAPLAPSADVVAPMARCVDDVVTLMAVMADGFAPASERDLMGARIGVLRRAFGEDPEVLTAMDAGLRAAREGGAVLVDPVVLPEALWPEGRESAVDQEFRAAFDAYLASNFAPGSAPASLAAIRAGGDHLADHAAALDRRAAALPDSSVRLAAAGYRAELTAALAALVGRHGLDAIAYPTCAVVPRSLDNPRGGWAPELAAASGWPALTLPVGRAASGVPIGFELLAAAHSEPALLALAAALERRLALRYRPTLD